MKKFISGVIASCAIATCFSQGVEPKGAVASISTPAAAADVEALRQQVQTLTEMVQQLQQQVKEQHASPPAPPTDVAVLPQGAEPPPPAADTGAPPTPTASAPPLFPTTDNAVVASAPPAPGAAGVDANGTANTFPTTDAGVAASGGASTSAGAALTQPIPIAGGGGKTYMNISFDGMFALAASSARDLYDVEVGDHDPQQRGFNARNAEIALDGAVDPYFEGFANIVLKLNNKNETEIELEEAFMQTTSLPAGLQAKGGQFFAPFGRINMMHPHTWDFADAPLVHGRLLGPDGLRGVGAQLAWTVPVPWYAQATFAVQNGRGGTGYSFRNPGDNGRFFARLTTDREMRGLQDFVYIPRVESSFNPSDTQTVLGGLSGAFGSNETGGHARTQIYGADLLYKWKSSHAEGGFPFVKWQTEAMYRRFEAGRGIDQTFPISETFHDWGLYSQVIWGFKKGWTAGLRGDYLHMSDSAVTDDDVRQTRSRISANLTWYPTEFSKLRLQYNHDFLQENEFLAGRDVDSVFFQFEFILGAHGAHKF
ncbi:MAG: TonB-dependent receptor [Verrucomicrobiota bacterium]|nr:TonB-dependent receptor [Verrucomicrobiota bacterium]